MSNDNQGKLGEVGPIGWDDIEVKTKNGGGGNGESLFLNMKQEGKYRMRVVSKPYQYYCHWVKTKSNKARKVNATLDGTDPVCIQENKGPQLKWLIKVLFRDPEKKTTVLKILDAGSQIMAQIKSLHEDKENFGDITKYDIIITKGPKNSKQPTYLVQALGSEKNPQSFTSEEVKMVKESSNSQSDKFVDVEKMCQPWTAERILAVINEESPEKPQSSPKEETSFLSEEDEKNFLDLDKL